MGLIGTAFAHEDKRFDVEGAKALIRDRQEFAPKDVPEPASPLPPTLAEIAAAVGALVYGDMMQMAEKLIAQKPESIDDMARALHKWSADFANGGGDRA